MKFIKIYLSILAANLIVISNAYAVCSSPSAPAGEFGWISASNDFRFCDGTSWFSVQNTVTANACSPAGALNYTSSEIQYCNNSNVWVKANADTLMGTCTKTGATAFSTVDYVMKWCNGTNWKRMGVTPDVNVSFGSSASSPTNATSYTFSSMSFGAASESRFIIVAVGERSGNSNSITSATIGGVSATVLRYYENPQAGPPAVAFLGAYVPMGTTGDVVINFASTVTRIVVATWRVTNLKSFSVADFSEATGTSNPPAIDIPAGGAMLAVDSADEGTGVTWGNATETYDVLQADNYTLNTSGAYKTTSSALTNYSVTATMSGIWNAKVTLLISLR